MADQQSTALPAYLADLLHPTPMGIATLLAAWDGLSVESQIRLLMALKETHCPAYLIERVYIRALDNDNAYIRYLAAKEFHCSYSDSEEQRRLKQRIAQHIAQRISLDPHPFVRASFLGEEKSSLFGGGLITESDPVAFFTLPHAVRLACARSPRKRGGHVARVIAYAVDHPLRNGTVSETELIEIIHEALHSEWEHQEREDIEALWRLVPGLPEAIADVLIEKLPGGAGGYFRIPDDILNTMTIRQLTILFHRADVGLTEIRKKSFFELAQHQLSWDDGRDRLWHAVVRYNFNLTYSEFLTILEKPEQEKVRMLCNLAFTARALSLCLYEAIEDVLLLQASLTEIDEERRSLRDHAAVARYEGFKTRLAPLQGWARKREVYALRLYRLARLAAPWEQDVQGVPPSGKLAFLAEEIVPGDTWRTFIAFSKRWWPLGGLPTKVKRDEELAKFLPPFPNDFQEYWFHIRQDDIHDNAIYFDCELDYYMQSEEDDLAENTTSAKHIDNQFTDLLSKVTETINSLSTNDIEDRYVELLSALTTSIQAVNALKDEHSKAMNDLKLNYERKHTEIIQYLSDVTNFTDHDLTNFRNSMKEYEERQEKRSQNFLNKINEESSALRDRIKLLFAILIVGFVVLLFMHK